jgi:hypothetical protein
MYCKYNVTMSMVNKCACTCQICFFIAYPNLFGIKGFVVVVV